MSLLDVVVRGNKDLVALHLKESGDISIRDRTGRNALHLAVEFGYFDIVELLFDYGCNGLCVDNKNMNILHIACVRNDHSFFHKLLYYLKTIYNEEELKQIIDLESNIGTPLMIATQRLNTDIVTDLLLFNATIFYSPQLHSSPLHESSYSGLESITKSFLYALDTNTKIDLINSSNSEGSNCLSLASEAGNEEIVRNLIENNANINHTRFMDGATPLFMACDEGYFNIVKILLDNNASMIGSPQTGAFPLFIACQRGYKDIVEIILKYIKDSETLDYEKEVNRVCVDGTPPLYIASAEGFDNIVELLLQYNVNVNHQVDTGATALFAACQNGHLESVKHLINHSADVTIARNDGVNSFYISCVSNKVRILLKNSNMKHL